MLQALILGINDDRLRRKLFDEGGGDTGQGLEKANRRCRIAEDSRNVMAAIQSEETLQYVCLEKKNNPTREENIIKRSIWAEKSKGIC
jgi:hypothetical protein